MCIVLPILVINWLQSSLSLIPLFTNYLTVDMSNPGDSEGIGEEVPLPKRRKEKTEPQEIPLKQVSLDVEPTTPEKPAQETGNPDPPVPEDPWSVIPELKDTGENWSDMEPKKKCLSTVITILKVAFIFGFLYFFICSLDLMQSAFRLLGGKAAGETFSNDAVLSNPLAGLMVGILTTVLVQSSSTSTSIVVSMVASDIINVKTAIPIIMGANIGTSVTNTIVSLTQSPNREEFRRAFAAATVHDMFNWLSVLVLLPLEAMTGYLLAITNAIVDSYEWQTSEGADKELLNVITQPFTNFVIMLDKEVVLGVALGDPNFQNRSMLKEWCKGYKSEFDVTQIINKTSNEHRCTAMFNQFQLSDTLSGVILLALSLAIMATCLILIVKLLNSMLRGRIAVIIKNTLNSDFPGKFAFLTGYLALLIGCGLTILVQSSSVFTSTLTPLVGIGVISLERMYPLTLGSNIGTTTTGILAALTATGPQLRSSIQIALCHLFFNLSGILLFYPVPFTRFPIAMAKGMGDITAKYRWFAIAYIILAFFILPAIIFALSMTGTVVFLCIITPIAVMLIVVAAISFIQNKRPALLPEKLKTWECLPLWMRSLEPIDQLIQKMSSGCSCKKKAVTPKPK